MSDEDYHLTQAIEDAVDRHAKIERFTAAGFPARAHVARTTGRHQWWNAEILVRLKGTSLRPQMVRGEGLTADEAVRDLISSLDDVAFSLAARDP